MKLVSLAFIALALPTTLSFADQRHDCRDRQVILSYMMDINTHRYAAREVVVQVQTLTDLTETDAEIRCEAVIYYADGYALTVTIIGRKGDGDSYTWTQIQHPTSRRLNGNAD